MGGCLKEIKKAIKPSADPKKPIVRRFNAVVTAEEYRDVDSAAILVNGHRILTVSIGLLPDFGLTDEATIDAKSIDMNGILNEVAYQLYVGWMAYYKGKNGRDDKTLLERLRKAKEILESADMWPPRVEP